MHVFDKVFIAGEWRTPHGQGAFEDVSDAVTNDAD